MGGGQTVYLKKIDGISVVLDPSCNPRRIAAAAMVSGVEVNAEFYHNSSLNKFPSRDNGGKAKERYGIDVDFGTLEQMGTFLKALAEMPPRA